MRIHSQGIDRKFVLDDEEKLNTLRIKLGFAPALTVKLINEIKDDTDFVLVIRYFPPNKIVRISRLRGCVFLAITSSKSSTIDLSKQIKKFSGLD